MVPVRLLTLSSLAGHYGRPHRAEHRETAGGIEVEWAVDVLSLQLHSYLQVIKPDRPQEPRLMCNDGHLFSVERDRSAALKRRARLMQCGGHSY